MLFNSLTFLGFFSLVFTIYWSINTRLRLQNLFLLVVSYIFYGWWDWRFLLLMGFSSLIDFVVANRIEQEERPKQRKLLLSVSLIGNLGLLGFFKYFNFFIDSTATLLSSLGFEPHLSTLSIILPVGISFYTFQTLSYTIDVYRGNLRATTDWVDFFVFVSFFPQLVAGPIERATNLLPQFAVARKFNLEVAVGGMRLILWGLFKKMVIADRLAAIVDPLYADPSGCNSWMVAAAAILFSYQIYCDFSGYSDIAIGTSRLLGFRLTRNFITPFLSASMTELWQRWHVSLNTWFRDYLYFPLGGSRVSKTKGTFIILLTFTVSGLWHGANVHFVLWGFIWGVAFAIERLLGIKRWGVFPTFLFFCFLSIIFRAPRMTDVMVLYENLFSFQFELPSVLPKGLPTTHEMLYSACALLILVLAEWRMGRTDIDEALGTLPSFVRWAAYYTLFVIIMLFGLMDNAPEFIYFQF